MASLVPNGPKQLYITISGYRSLSQSPGTGSFELAVVENPRFAVGILIISVILSVSVIEVLLVWQPHCYFRLSVNVTFICEHFV